jgi:glucose-6-phosphate 1-dehydrogenase
MSTPRSDALVFFGITGDLAYKQVIPALQALLRDGRLDVPIIGVAKAGWDLDQVKARVRASLEAHGAPDQSALARFYERLHYIDGDYSDPATFEQLRTALGAATHPLFYLAIPPSLFALVAERLKAAGLAAHARIMVEKPFGRDLASARALNAALRRCFPESAIFRIDHYIDKESFLNMLYFRLANMVVEPIWSRHYIESVQITMAENFGVQGRGRFYEETGAIRDVVQNHVLQVAATIAMEPLHASDPQLIADAATAAMQSMAPIDPSRAVRGQFEGYRNEPGVAPDSTVETFAALALSFDVDRWRGVPFYLRAGKCLPVTCTEVLVRLKSSSHAVPDFTSSAANYVRFRLTPDGLIALGVHVKQPGDNVMGEAIELIAHERPAGQEAPYERLLLHAAEGDRTVFVNEERVEAAWRVVAPLLAQDTPLHVYQPGTWGPAEADQILPPGDHWHNPSPAEVPGG